MYMQVITEVIIPCLLNLSGGFLCLTGAKAALEGTPGLQTLYSSYSCGGSSVTLS